MTRNRFLVLAGVLLTLSLIVSCAAPAATETPTVEATLAASPTIAAVASPTAALAASPTAEAAAGTETPTPLAGETPTEAGMAAETPTP